MPTPTTAPPHPRIPRSPLVFSSLSPSARHFAIAVPALESQPSLVLCIRHPLSLLYLEGDIARCSQPRVNKRRSSREQESLLSPSGEFSGAGLGCIPTFPVSDSHTFPPLLISVGTSLLPVGLLFFLPPLLNICSPKQIHKTCLYAPPPSSPLSPASSPASTSCAPFARSPCRRGDDGCGPSVSFPLFLLAGRRQSVCRVALAAR